ncbi:unnamed protein product [Rangifer tarandus platyrhynchus]|uniref:Uncharacterized protein n=1 Tax=Rangifer tarandus platyrhynchus TaxID=3082113 RepID=A0ABN8ZBV4_RANTA|nr:unnamed protein product [Rangifer tarandus platyrhynchus]
MSGAREKKALNVESFFSSFSEGKILKTEITETRCRCLLATRNSYPSGLRGGLAQEQAPGRRRGPRGRRALCAESPCASRSAALGCLGCPVLSVQRSTREDRPWGATESWDGGPTCPCSSGTPEAGPEGRHRPRSCRAEPRGCLCAGHRPRGLPGPGVPGPQPAERRSGRAVSQAAPRRLGRWGAPTALPQRSSLERGFLLIARPEPGRVAQTVSQNITVNPGRVACTPAFQSTLAGTGVWPPWPRLAELTPAECWWPVHQGG